MLGKLSHNLKGHLAGRFQQDVLWNVGGLAVTGACGVVLNLVIGLCYGSLAPLGVFNQVFAVYIIFSQVGVLGVQHSTLKHIAEHVGAPQRQSAVLLAGLLVVVICSAALSGLFYLSRHTIAGWFGSPEVAGGIAWALPGMFLFAINKVLLNAVNGLRWMKSFAILRTIRPVLMILSIVTTCVGRLPVATLAASLSVAEIGVTASCLILLWRRGGLVRPVDSIGKWCKVHFGFGLRGFVSGVVMALNTRVDILMLSYFTKNTELVGIYSFAAVLAEGIAQLLVVLRNNYSPLIVRLLSAGAKDELRAMVRKGQWVTGMLMLGIGALVVGTFPAACSLGGMSKFLVSWPLLATLMAGIVLASAYMPFNNILLLAGRPGVHALMTVGVVTFNVSANAMLIPIWSAQGAAVATGLAFVFYAFSVFLLSRTVLKIRL